MKTYTLQYTLHNGEILTWPCHKDGDVHSSAPDSAMFYHYNENGHGAKLVEKREIITNEK